MNIKIFSICIAAAITCSCATRQTSDTVSGSTAQRLVTYSLEKFVTELVSQPELAVVTGTQTRLNVHFLKNHPLMDYTEELLKYHLVTKHNVELTDNTTSPRYEINVFFNSIGTDYDTYGLSVPTLGLAATPNSRISLLAIDMFHGVTEGYATVKNTQTNKTTKSTRLLARVRADNVATPILDFPINQLE